MDENTPETEPPLPLEQCDWTTPYERRHPDYRDPRSKVTEAQWGEAKRRYHGGEAIETVARDLGVGANRTRINITRRFGLKRDNPEAVHRPRGRAALPGSVRWMASDPALALDVDVQDPDGCEVMFAAAIEEAMRTGAAGQVRVHTQTLADLRKMWADADRRGRAGAGLVHMTGGGAGAGPGAARPAEAVRLHAHQTPPARAEDGGDWRTWLVLGGRGAGKTLAGASWLAEVAEDLGAGGRVAIVGATLHDAREVMIEGPSGLMGLGRWWTEDGWKGPTYSASRRRVAFPGGAVGMVFSAEDADSLRGPQFHAGWADEFCAWARGSGDRDVLAMVRLGLRLGEAPRLCVTTTPRPTAALKALLAEPGVAVTRAGTRANAAHLSAGFVEGLERLYGGTRLAAQEIEGQVVDDGLALWTAEGLAGALGPPPPVFDLVVVGVDPTTTGTGNACGIVVVGRAGDRAHVMADWSVAGRTPEGWARRVASACETYKATLVVAEVNQGGDMVRSVLSTQLGRGIEVREVRATKGKAVRAEPVAALYEQGRVKHSGAGLGRLEEELMALGPEATAGTGLDRADALVWAVTALLIDRVRDGGAAKIRAL